MAGCFGSHPVDRWMEKQLDDYLSQFEEKTECPHCGFVGYDEDWDYTSDDDMICPSCHCTLRDGIIYDVNTLDDDE